MNPFLFALMSIVLVAFSQFLFKRGVMEVNEILKDKSLEKRQFILALIRWPIIAGLMINVVAAGFWLLALSDLELSYVFPFLALNYILVPLGASVLYKEKLTNYKMAGIIVITIGVLFVAFS